MFDVNEQGLPVLKISHFRAGHWPGIKNPPWGLNDLPTLDLCKQFGLNIDEDLCFPAVLETRDTLVVVTLQERKDPSTGFRSVFAHPVDPERWIMDD